MSLMTAHPLGTELPASHPDLAEHDLVTDSQDIAAVLQHIPQARTRDLAGVTGVLERALDADTLEVWATGSARPFDVAARYTRVL